MEASIEDASVTGYTPLITGLYLPDPCDRHVLAAAIVGRADVIVTKNLRDFPDETLETFGLKAQYPDTFAMHLMSLAPADVAETARVQRARLRNPAKSVDEFLAILERQELTQTVAALRPYRALL